MNNVIRHQLFRLTAPTETGRPAGVSSASPTVQGPGRRCHSLHESWTFLILRELLDKQPSVVRDSVAW